MIKSAIPGVFKLFLATQISASKSDATQTETNGNLPKLVRGVIFTEFIGVRVYFGHNTPQVHVFMGFFFSNVNFTLKGYDYGSLSYFIIVKNKLVNKIENKLGRNIV